MTGLGSRKELAEDKLILLYFIDRLDMPVNNLHLTKHIMECRFMSYFFVQQFLTELCESGDLQVAVIDNMSVYMLTDHGRQTLGYFKNRILPGIRKNIDESARAIRRSIRQDISVTADFTPVNENEFIAECAIREGDFLMVEVKAAIGTRKDARAVCDNWKNHSSEIYGEIIKSLTKTRGSEKD